MSVQKTIKQCSHEYRFDAIVHIPMVSLATA